jgi:hypothetical protein
MCKLFANVYLYVSDTLPSVSLGGDLRCAVWDVLCMCCLLGHSAGSARTMERPTMTAASLVLYYISLGLSTYTLARTIYSTLDFTTFGSWLPGLPDTNTYLCWKEDLWFQYTPCGQTGVIIFHYTLAWGVFPLMDDCTCLLIFYIALSGWVAYLLGDSWGFNCWVQCLPCTLGLPVFFINSWLLCLPGSPDLPCVTPLERVGGLDCVGWPLRVLPIDLPGLGAAGGPLRWVTCCLWCWLQWGCLRPFADLCSYELGTVKWYNDVLLPWTVGTCMV